jgi:peptidoglycan hydrolase CwlO-like protein
MEDELNAKTQMAEQYSFDKRQLAEKIDLLESQKKGGENKVTELQSQLEKIKSETAVLKAQIKEKDEAITRLENNVKLLKKELGR